MPKTKTDSELYAQYWEAAQEIDKRGGRMDSYAAPHVWNLVAKTLRDEYDNTITTEPSKSQQRVLERLALTFAKRFTEDAGFNPLSFLDKCSPDPDLYPFSEMWEADE